jgi:hypothetical protein
MNSVSALYGDRNAWIDFKIPTAGTTIDGLGNVNPNHRIIRFEAFLKVATGKTAIDEMQLSGIDLNSRSLQGYVFRGTEPLLLPFSVPSNCWYQGAFGREVGSFYLRSPSQYGRAGIDEIVEQFIGTNVSLYFQAGY